MVKAEEMKKDTREFAEILKERTQEEKMYIAGVIAGMKAARGQEVEEKKAG